MRFAIGNNAIGAAVFGPAAGYCLYEAWRFAFRYQEELLKPVRGRQAGYQHLFLQDHGHIGVALLLALGILASWFALNGGWRAWTAFPAAIIMADRLWLHPSFGKQPIPFSNIVSVRLDRVVTRGFRSVILIVELDESAKRNRIFWAYPFATNKWSVSETAVDCSLYGLARFRDRLVTEAQQARRTRIQ